MTDSNGATSVSDIVAHIGDAPDEFAAPRAVALRRRHDAAKSICQKAGQHRGGDESEEQRRPDEEYRGAEQAAEQHVASPAEKAPQKGETHQHQGEGNAPHPDRAQRVIEETVISVAIDIGIGIGIEIEIDAGVVALDRREANRGQQQVEQRRYGWQQKDQIPPVQQIHRVTA